MLWKNKIKMDIWAAGSELIWTSTGEDQQQVFVGSTTPEYNCSEEISHLWVCALVYSMKLPQLHRYYNTQCEDSCE